MSEVSVIYDDNEQKWSLLNKDNGGKLYYQHVERDTLFRIIDPAECEVKFSDISRLIKIVDIDKALIGQSDDAVNARYKAICNKLLDEIKPITMPYTPEVYKCYIEVFPEYLGVLYFRNEKGDMVECRRFFKLSKPVKAGPMYEEINFHDYTLARVEWLERSEDALVNGSDKKGSDKH